MDWAIIKSISGIVGEIDFLRKHKVSMQNRMTHFAGWNIGLDSV